jgi:hypothetical protein
VVIVVYGAAFFFAGMVALRPGAAVEAFQECLQEG